MHTKYLKYSEHKPKFDVQEGLRREGSEIKLLIIYTF